MVLDLELELAIELDLELLLPQELVAELMLELEVDDAPIMELLVLELEQGSEPGSKGSSR